MIISRTWIFHWMHLLGVRRILEIRKNYMRWLFFLKPRGKWLIRFWMISGKLNGIKKRLVILKVYADLSELVKWTLLLLLLLFVSCEGYSWVQNIWYAWKHFSYYILVFKTGMWERERHKYRLCPLRICFWRSL